MTSSAVITAVLEFIGHRGGGLRSVNHGYRSKGAVRDVSSLLLRTEERKIVEPSVCVMKREIQALCPSHSTRGKNVIRFTAAVLFFVTIFLYA